MNLHRSLYLALRAGEHVVLHQRLPHVLLQRPGPCVDIDSRPFDQSITARQSTPIHQLTPHAPTCRPLQEGLLQLVPRPASLGCVVPVAVAVTMAVAVVRMPMMRMTMVPVVAPGPVRARCRHWGAAAPAAGWLARLGLGLGYRVWTPRSHQIQLRLVRSPIVAAARPGACGFHQCSGWMSSMVRSIEPLAWVSQPWRP